MKVLLSKPRSGNSCEWDGGWLWWNMGISISSAYETPYEKFPKRGWDKYY